MHSFRCSEISSFEFVVFSSFIFDEFNKMRPYLCIASITPMLAAFSKDHHFEELYHILYMQLKDYKLL